MGNPVVGNPVVGNPVVGNPAVGNPVVGNPVVGNPAVGNPVIIFLSSQCVKHSPIVMITAIFFLILNNTYSKET